MEEAFEHDSRLDEHDAAEHGRNEVRDSMMLQAPMRRLSGDTSAMMLRVRNLSVGGLMADCSDVVARDERIVVDLRGIGEVAGRVAWARAGRLGVAFDVHIDPLRARKPVAAGHKRAVVPGLASRRPGLKLG